MIKTTVNVSKAATAPVVEHIISSIEKRGKKLKILHIEDVVSDALLISNQLKKSKLDFEILLVDSKDKFIKELMDFNPDIILSDHTLPSFNSNEALTTLHESGLKIPFILVTATMSDELAVDLIKKGADDYILKDRLNRLPAAIQIAIETNRLKRIKEAIIDELLTSQLHLKEAQTVAKLGSWEIDLQTFILKWSEETHRIFETDPKTFQATYNSFLSFVHPDERTSVDNSLNYSLNSKTINSIEHKITATNGTVKYVIENWKIFRDTQGNPVRAIGTCQDITQRRIEDEEKNSLQTTLQSSLNEIYIYDIESLKFIYVNKGALLNLGYSEQEIKELTQFDLKPEFTTSSYKQLVAPLLNNEKEKIIFFTNHKRKNGTLYPVEVHLQLVKEGNNKRFLAIILDITDRKIAEDKLNVTSNELLLAVADLNKILDSSLDIICTINASGEFVNVNAASQQVLGYKSEELIGSKFMSLVYYEDVDITIDAAEKVIKNIQIPVFENRYVHKSGRIVPLLWSVNWDEKLKLMFCIAKDVTEKKRLEKAVENERDQFFQMFLKAPAAIGLLKGPDHVFEMVNPLYLKLIGNRDVIGKTTASVLPESIDQGLIDILDNVYRTGKSYAGTEMLIKLDREGNGTLTDTFVNFIYQAYKNNEGVIEGIFLFINDITEQILSRKETERSEKFFKGVIENSDDMITIINSNRKTIYASPAVSRTYGFTPMECLNLNMEDIVHPDDVAIMQGFIIEIMKHPGVPMELPSLRNRKKDGTYIWLEGTLTNFLETEGINAIVANFRDVTERKKANELIVRSEANLNAIIENTEASIYSLDRNLRYITFNKNLYNSQKQIYGLDVKPGDNVYDFLGKLSLKEAKEWKKAYSKALKGETVKFEKEVINHDFHAYINFSIHPIWENENVIGLSCFALDITKQKKVDEKNRFRAHLLNTIGQAAVATDINGVVNYWNKAAENIYGWTKEEALGKNIIDLTPSEATTEQGLQIIEMLKRGETWSGEFKVRKKDGTTFPAHVTDSPIYDENNVLSGIIGISSDISEKKKLEELLDKSNRLARIGSWEIDVIKNTVFWSDITKEIREVGADFIPQLNKGISYFNEGRDKEIITQRVKDCIDKGVAWDEELEITTHKGNMKWVRTIGEGDFVDGKCIRVYGSFQDISARKKAELEAIKVYEEKNRILESIGDSFFAVDKEWTVTYWNKEAEKVFLTPKSKIIGNNLWHIFPTGINSASYKKYLEATDTNEVITFENYYAALDKWLEISAYPSVSGLSIFLKDITDRKLSDLQLSALNLSLSKHVKDLAASNKELEEFAYVASHDLQEPLRMVTGFLGLVKEKYSDVIDDKGKQYIHFAVDGAKRMRQIILDLIEFSRIGRTEDTEIFTNLSDVVQEVISLYKNQINETKAIISIENLPSLVTNKTSLRQVFQNLISNALKYHTKGKPPIIRISAEENETHWQFAISDNGIGIEHEYFNKVFVIFQRLHSKDEYSGTGIGLAICKKIIENLGGKIWLESEENRGSIFYFTIPKQ